MTNRGFFARQRRMREWVMIFRPGGDGSDRYRVKLSDKLLLVQIQMMTWNR
jgi:hypothetical protein